MRQKLLGWVRLSKYTKMNTEHAKDKASTNLRLCNRLRLACKRVLAPVVAAIKVVVVVRFVGVHTVVDNRAVKNLLTSTAGKKKVNTHANQHIVGLDCGETFCMKIMRAFGA